MVAWTRWLQHSQEVDEMLGSFEWGWLPVRMTKRWDLPMSLTKWWNVPVMLRNGGRCSDKMMERSANWHEGTFEWRSIDALVGGPSDKMVEWEVIKWSKHFTYKMAERSSGKMVQMFHIENGRTFLWQNGGIISLAKLWNVPAAKWWDEQVKKMMECFSDEMGTVPVTKWWKPFTYKMAESFSDKKKWHDSMTNFCWQNGEKFTWQNGGTLRWHRLNVGSFWVPLAKWRNFPGTKWWLIDSCQMLTPCSAHGFKSIPTDGQLEEEVQVTK